MGPSLWKKGCRSGWAIVPAPFVWPYRSHSFDALSLTENDRKHVLVKGRTRVNVIVNNLLELHLVKGH